jgi:hypothetical protein
MACFHRLTKFLIKRLGSCQVLALDSDRHGGEAERELDDVHGKDWDRPTLAESRGLQGGWWKGWA